jgi:hypothetical protein
MISLVQVPKFKELFINCLRTGHGECYCLKAQRRGVRNKEPILDLNRKLGGLRAGGRSSWTVVPKVVLCVVY